MSVFMCICVVPEYKQSSLCILHTWCSAGVLTADGADLPSSLHCSAPQGRVRGLGCHAADSGTKTGTSHKTGLTGRPDRTCTLSRNLSGTAPRIGRRSPRRRCKGKGIKTMLLFHDLRKITKEFCIS